jgi:hypothetical protein
MKKRYLYALLFGLPGLFLAGGAALVVFGASFGVLWLFVFGDNPWPAWMETTLSIALVLVFLTLWSGSIFAGYHIGKRLEKDSALHWTHILLSLGLTTALILFIVFQQWSVGNLGPKSDSVLCSDYCAAQGYAGSGMPPQNSGDRTCSCYDASGNEVLKVLLENIKPGGSK